MQQSRGLWKDGFAALASLSGGGPTPDFDTGRSRYDHREVNQEKKKLIQIGLLLVQAISNKTYV